MFWGLVLFTVHMLAFGSAGETGQVNASIGFAIGMCGRALVLFDNFVGEAGGYSNGCTEAVKTSFDNICIIVCSSWSIYPIGYFLDCLISVADEQTLDLAVRR